MKKIGKRTLISVAAAAVLIAFIAYAVSRPPSVECVILAPSTLENTFTEMGEVTALDESKVFTRLGGKLLEVRAEDGGDVEAGSLMFIFDSSELIYGESELLAQISVLDSQIDGLSVGVRQSDVQYTQGDNQIRSQILALEAQKKTLESGIESLRIQKDRTELVKTQQLESLESVRLLFDIGEASKLELNDAQTAYDLASKSFELSAEELSSAPAQIAAIDGQIAALNRSLGLSQGLSSAQGSSSRQTLLAQRDVLGVQLEMTRTNIEETQIAAPQSGVIRGLSVKAGQIIPPGTQLCSVYTPNEYRVECFIPVSNVGDLKAGDKTDIILDMRDGDRTFSGIVTRLAPDAVETVSKVGLREKRIKVELSVSGDGWELLGPEWPVEVRFVTARSQDCLSAPKTALFENNGILSVWAVREGKVTAVPVERGIQSQSQVELRGGLAAGDILIRNAAAGNIKEGMRANALT